MTIDDVLGAELATGRAVPTATEGEPYERWHVISDDGRVELVAEGQKSELEAFLREVREQFFNHIRSEQRDTLPATNEFTGFDIRH